MSMLRYTDCQHHGTNAKSNVLATEQLAKIAAWNRGWWEGANWQQCVLKAPGLTTSQQVDVGEMLVDRHKTNYIKRMYGEDQGEK